MRFRPAGSWDCCHYVRLILEVLPDTPHTLGHGSYFSLRAIRYAIKHGPCTRLPGSFIRRLAGMTCLLPQSLPMLIATCRYSLAYTAADRCVVDFDRDKTYCVRSVLATCHNVQKTLAPTLRRVFAMSASRVRQSCDLLSRQTSQSHFENASNMQSCARTTRKNASNNIPA